MTSVCDVVIIMPMPVRHTMANKPHPASVMERPRHSGEIASQVDMPDHGVEGRAQGIRAEMRELKRHGRS